MSSESVCPRCPCDCNCGLACVSVSVVRDPHLQLSHRPLCALQAASRCSSDGLAGSRAPLLYAGGERRRGWRNEGEPGGSREQAESSERLKESGAVTPSGLHLGHFEDFFLFLELFGSNEARAAGGDRAQLTSVIGDR